MKPYDRPGWICMERSSILVLDEYEHGISENDGISEKR